MSVDRTDLQKRTQRFVSRAAERKAAQAAAREVRTLTRGRVEVSMEGNDIVFTVNNPKRELPMNWRKKLGDAFVRDYMAYIVAGG